MKIYTRTGDEGETGLTGGSRVSKSHAVVRTCGEIDEANSHLGCAIAIAGETNAGETNAGDNSQLKEICGWVVQIQNDLFDLGSHVAASSHDRGDEVSIPITDGQIRQLEDWIDLCDDRLEPLRHFILPGGSPFASHLHLARTVCRRAERSLVGLVENGTTADLARDLIYLNRLGDLLFILARDANRIAGHPEPRWMGKS